MAIERIIMAEGGISPDISNVTPVPAEGAQLAEPSVLINEQAERPKILQRILGKKSKAEILVEAEGRQSGENKPDIPRPYKTDKFDPEKIDQYRMETRGQYSIAIDPDTGKEVARFPIIAGGSNENDPHSQMPELTNAEVQIFLDQGQTIEMLLDAKNHMHPEVFKNIAKSKLREINELKEKGEKEKKGKESEKASLTEDEKEAKKKEEKDEKEKKLKELENELIAANELPTGTEKEQLLVKLLKRNLQKEIDHLNGRESEVIDKEDLEVEASKERGLEVAKIIVRYEALVKSGKHLTEDEWKILDGAYLDQKIHIEARRWVQGKMKDVGKKEKEENPAKEFRELVNTELFKDINTFRDLNIAYKTGGFARMTPEQKEQFRKELVVYLNEAKDVGMLEEMDKALRASWKEVNSGIERKLSIPEIMANVDRNIRMALQNTQDIFANRQWTDDGIAHLADFDEREGVVGVWDLYAKFARERFVTAIQTKDINYEKGRVSRQYLRTVDGEIVEFEIGAEDDEEEEAENKETYWKVSESGWYVQIYAKTEEQFNIAADTYITRLQAISAAPDKVLQDSGQFVDQIMRSDGAKNVSEAFLKQLAWGIEARLGVYGADHSNELYHGDYYKRYLDHVNKDGYGPDRWLNLAKSMDGKVAAALWLMDNDPRWDIIFTMYGSRGQLSDASYAQRSGPDGWGLHNQALELLIEELVGVELKDKGLIDNVTKAGSKKDFASNFRGLHLYDGTNEEKHGNAHLSVYQEYHHRKVKEGKFTDDADGTVIDHEDKLPKDVSDEIRQSFRLGRIQHQLEEYKEEIKHGKRPKATIKGKDVYYDPAKDNLKDLLLPKDKKFYEGKVHDTHKAVHLALEMYGAFGEKSKRGGGAFKTTEKVDSEGKKYQYFIPEHMAEKFVQMAVTMTKIRYANKSAKERTKAVKKAIKEASAGLKKNGYDAVLEGEDGNNMAIKRPKENPNKPGEVLKNAITGEVVTEEVPLDFYTATHHQFANWTGHTYWSYQEEDRHLLLADSTFIEAKDILNGKIRPEDASIWANQLIILDPTLKRVRRFVEKNFEDRERKLTMAAVEDSYQTHWEIGRELHREFFPEFGTPAEEIGMYYGLQDFGGFRKMNESMRIMFGQDPDRFMRRGRRLLPDLHNPISTYAEYLGRGTDGMMGVLQMMDAPVYRGAGSMALDKFSAQAEVAAKLFGALCGSKEQDGTYKEGLLLKLTNNSDKLRALIKQIPGFKEDAWTEPDNQNSAAYAIIDSLGRLKTYLQWFTVMESDIRNATGAFDLREIDVLVDDEGNLNTAVMTELDSIDESLNLSFADSTTSDLTQSDIKRIIKERANSLRNTEEQFNNWFNELDIDEQKSPNTGSGKHSALEFYKVFGELLIGIAGNALEEYKLRKEDGAPLRDGPELYEGEAIVYSHIFDKVVYDVIMNDEKVRKTTKGSIWDFIFTKFVPI